MLLGFSGEVGIPRGPEVLCLAVSPCEMGSVVLGGELPTKRGVLEVVGLQAGSAGCAWPWAGAQGDEHVLPLFVLQGSTSKFRTESHTMWLFKRH